MAISPGTWRVSGTREVYSDALPRENCVVAEILDGSDEDAALIAAAPELLAAAKALAEYRFRTPDDPCDTRYFSVLERLKAAVAAAEGRSE
jgi:hypothetical protein